MGGIHPWLNVSRPFNQIPVVIILSTNRGRSPKMQEVCSQTVTHGLILSRLASSTTTHNWLKSDMSGQKKKSGPRKPCPPGKMGNRPFTEFKGKPASLSMPGNKISHEGFQLESPLQHDTQRAAIIADVKGKTHQQQSLFTKAMTTQESSLKASYAVSLELAKAKKPMCSRDG